MARREGGQLALDRRACRSAAEGHARGPLLSTRPGDHGGDRPVLREGAGQPRLLSQQALRRWLAPLPDRISQSVIFWDPHYPAYLINREAATAWVGTRPRARNRREVSSGAVRCVLSWPLAFCLPSVLLPTPQRCVTPNRRLATCARLNLLLSPRASPFPAGLLNRRGIGWIVTATERIDPDDRIFGRVIFYWRRIASNSAKTQTQ